jgi:predicted metal-dependent hydrolase
MTDMSVEYSIVYSDRKTIRISVERDRSVIVRAPKNVSEDRIRQIVLSKVRWIKDKINAEQKYPANEVTKDFVSGESLLFLGKPYQINLVDNQEQDIIFDSKFLIRKNSAENINRLLREWYFETAKEIIIPKATNLAKTIGVSFRKIDIRNLEYRWGSCTPTNNIHFNWRLVKAPMIVIEYVIVHELTHLLERNHSADFWRRVRTAYPLSSTARSWLKTHGHNLETDF